MNPEAIEWLENLSDDNRGGLFAPAISCGGMFSVKDDHEKFDGRVCVDCQVAHLAGELVVIG